MKITCVNLKKFKVQQINRNEHVLHVFSNEVYLIEFAHFIRIENIHHGYVKMEWGYCRRIIFHYDVHELGVFQEECVIVKKQKLF